MLAPARAVRTLLAAAASLLVVVPAAAEAQVPWAGCQPAPLQCATVEVPLDRTGSVPGTLRLAVQRIAAAQNPRKVATLALAGGPGQAATPIAAEFATALRPALADRDFLVFDQRGTGASGSLTCPALSRNMSDVLIARGCATEIGAARGFFRTPDSVQDIEAIRRRAGYEKLVIYGVSYGTKVALQYAAAFPDRVEALVLDSTVLADGPDPLRVSSLGAVPRVLRELCAGSECRRATPSVSADVRELAKRLRKRALRGSVVTQSGRKARFKLGQSALFEILLAGDLNPTLRAELPGAMRAARRGDVQPLLRLGVRSAGLEHAARFQSARADSDALFLATVCEEAPFRWTRTAGIEQRAREITAAARSIPRAALGPFSPAVALESGVAPLCLGWPTASPAPVPTPALPQVPTLVLTGRGDLRTPLEDVAVLQQALPGAQIVPIPHVGHSVLGTDLSGCSERAIAAFFAAQPQTPCTAENPFSPTPRPPRTLDAFGKVGGLPAKVGRTLNALDATLTDARRQVIGASIALDRSPSSVGGLRAGRAVVRGDDLDLRAYEYLRGVSVTGRLRSDGSGRFRVRGSRGARGTVTFGAQGATARGRLGGRRIDLSRATAASRGDDLPSLRQVLALPGIR